MTDVWKTSASQARWALLAEYFANARREMTRVLVTTYAGIREGLELWERYERLSRLSDAELRRLGLTRADVVTNGLSPNRSVWSDRRR